MKKLNLKQPTSPVVKKEKPVGEKPRRISGYEQQHGVKLNTDYWGPHSETGK